MMRTTTDSLECARCGHSFTLPDEVTEAVQSQVASEVRAGRIMAAIQRLRENGLLDLRTCKFVALHITLEKNRCHRCQAARGDQRISSCRKCHCLNLDW